MGYSKKRLIAAVMAGVMAAMCAFPGYAASRKKITSVTLTIKADIEPDTDFGMENIEIESNSNRYSVDSYDVLNEGFAWTEDMIPEIRITLTADDDYYFTALAKDKVTLKGGATFKRSTFFPSNVNPHNFNFFHFFLSVLYFTKKDLIAEMHFIAKEKSWMKSNICYMENAAERENVLM